MNSPRTPASARGLQGFDLAALLATAGAHESQYQDAATRAVTAALASKGLVASRSEGPRPATYPATDPATDPAREPAGCRIEVRHQAATAHLPSHLAALARYDEDYLLGYANERLAESGHPALKRIRICVARPLR